MNNLSLHLDPILPAWLIALIALGLLGLLAYGSHLLLTRKQVPRKWVLILGVLRVAVVVLAVLCLLQPIVSYQRTAEQLPEMLVMLDTSQSMGLPGDQPGQ